ncbi:MAG: ABC transporter permease [Eubacterium sp.]|nr:ABC transporter permease [Eubacterium sp.]
MRKTILLAQAHLRKAKGQTAAIVALALLASLMLNLWLMLAMDYKQNFDRYHDKLNAEHVTLAITGDDDGLRDDIVEILEEDERTADYFMEDAILLAGAFSYNGGEVNPGIVFLEKQAALSRRIGQIEVVEDSGYDSGIYLPMIYGGSGEYDIGDTFQITAGSEQVSYTVCGFLNSVMAGSHNCSMAEFLLTPDCYRQLQEDGIGWESTLVSIRLHDRRESESYQTMLNRISEKHPNLYSLSNCYALVSQSRYISQMICSGVLNAMAFFVLLIALVMIASNLTNYIQENMKNFGALKALGYTGSQLVGSLLLQFMGISLLTAMAGEGLSYCIFPAINTMMVAQTGIPYEIRFLPLPFAYTLLILEGTVALVVWASSRRMRKIEPIVALRQGVRTHNFKRNHVPLEMTRTPLHLALALKTAFSGMKQNFVVCLTMLVLSLVVVFSGVMVENFIADMDPFVDMVVGETADVCIAVNAETEDELVREMGSDGRVEKVYLFHSAGVEHVGGLQLFATLTEDYTDLNNQEMVFEGRFPKYDNEIAVGAKYANEKGLRIGSEIVLSAEGKEASYIICGLTQISNYLGKDCLLTRSGYERIGTLQDATYYLNLQAGTDIDAFIEETREKYSGNVTTAINIQSVIGATAGIYVSLMTMIVAAVLILSVVIIVFVLYLLVRAMLNSKKEYYGTLKALGYTTGQLILQTALSFMPAMVLSTIVGLLLCSLVINPLIALFLRGIGMVRCTYAVPADLITVAGVGLVLFAFMTVCLLSLKIRRISPEGLLTGE